MDRLSNVCHDPAKCVVIQGRTRPPSLSSLKTLTSFTGHSIQPLSSIHQPTAADLMHGPSVSRQRSTRDEHDSGQKEMLPAYEGSPNYVDLDEGRAGIVGQ